MGGLTLLAQDRRLRDTSDHVLWGRKVLAGVAGVARCRVSYHVLWGLYELEEILLRSYLK